ncbi:MULTISPECIES: hypothetical protein [unclassified Exiguobacterium]|uniref:hypothetical protein n=1 Tax=unclassified Exiguobacterium TaxID=2644629 RepID=UPI0008ADBEBA|nr:MULTISPECIES: hypothetical protein [unclassified Exiguobacterium]OGX80574.1 hypothetical protein A6395_00840 [Exiguobacterium sp. SH31]TCI35709.1 hypothetical protein EVJ29_09640 [Exiguobacterium sp. SH4S7]TCI65215.1 hypothetical protein EVJ21_01055 [Exiguobacterium sp. SH0S2]TCI80364.1 hypothetical protein EVJ20_03365 [Exiguobacterium sp. SH0S1]
MMFPIYLVTGFVILVLVATATTIYIKVYKRRRTDAVQSNSGQGAAIAPPDKLAIVLFIVTIVVSVLISYVAGYTDAYKAYEQDVWVLSPSDIETFYAEVREVEDDAIEVQKMSFDDATDQGTIRYEIVKEHVSIYRQDKIIQLSDLSEEDLISVILMKDRSGMTSVFKIELLNNQN